MQDKNIIINKLDLIQQVIRLLTVLNNESYSDVDKFVINFFDKTNKQHNFYLYHKLFEIQNKNGDSNILAETKSITGQFFKIGKIPCKFLNTIEMQKLVDLLLYIIEHHQVINSIDDLLD